ncbi:MAG: alanine--tRNA ligase [Candidatus Omnitrophica bacterium]|nr:alanine--tRNA ligase [Candidatus Omnitrophota bacterium]
MKADQIRKRFLEFFQQKGHRVVPSDSLVPKDDPTVLFTPAGMNQFKKQFLGFITDFTRATSCQRCLRTDDLEKVGKTDCHHTFFEMLGNFSFGDYFKKEAITWAWEFLTKELSIPEEKLWVSVYLEDKQAYEIWNKDIDLPSYKIVKLGEHDNFWPADAKEKGPNGPCGPCSEIFFDLGETSGCGKKDCSPACGCGRFVEVWNLVFTQFNRKDSGILEPLPQKNIDTGMGLERISAVMQEVRSNFQTDLFIPLVKEIRSFAEQKDESLTPFIYAISDHVRAVVFAIFDGVLPSNEARGYVVRKLIRKSCLHLRQIGIKEPFLYRLVPIVSELMRNPYPELNKERETIAQIILAEEKNFNTTLDNSEELLKERYSKIQNKQDAQTVGEIAFQLYDTYGIPLAVTQDWLNKYGYTFSQEAFDRALQRQKERSKITSFMQGDVFSTKELELKDVAETVFVGYDSYVTNAQVLKILFNNKEIEQASEGEEVTIILDRTPFYAEAGGQVGDTGSLQSSIAKIIVKDTKKLNKLHLHQAVVRSGKLKVKDTVEAKIDIPRRKAIMRNHTATHLLQAALRKVLGNHIQQQGSFVSDERLRFDFTHFKGLTQDELDRVEELVNSFIRENAPVQKEQMDLEEARKKGALAFFAEKYEGIVRVVTIENISKELCGGTHLDATGEIGLFKITSESSIASGVRRIEAVTGEIAFNKIKQQEQLLRQISEILKTSNDKLITELEKRVKQIRELEKKLVTLQDRLLESSLDKLLEKIEQVKGINIITTSLPEADLEVLRKVADLLKQKVTNILIAVGSAKDGRANIVIATNSGQVDASKLIKDIASYIGGSGGGRKDFAQAGGPRTEQLSQALSSIKDLLLKSL